MRPKKKILLIDSDETRCSVRSFVLSNRGFLVYPVANAGDARRTVGIVTPDLLMLCWPFDAAAALLDELHKQCPLMPSMAIAEKLTEAPADLIADEVLLKGRCSQFDITERAKAMCARKRGPRKFMPVGERMPVQEVDLLDRKIA